MPLKYFLYAALMLMVGVLVAFLLKRMMFGDRLEPDEQNPASLSAPATAQVFESKSEPPPSAPIELKLNSTSWRNSLFWAIGLAFGAMVLFGEPDLLWTRWLAWTVAGVMALLVPLSLAFAWSDWQSRLIASPSGLEWRDGFTLHKRVAWEQVGAVRLVEHWAKNPGSSGIHGSQAQNYIARKTLLLSDKQGATLMEFDEPLRPAEAYRQFLNAATHWSGVAPTKAKTENGQFVAP